MNAREALDAVRSIVWSREWGSYLRLKLFGLRGETDSPIFTWSVSWLSSISLLFHDTRGKALGNGDFYE